MEYLVVDVDNQQIIIPESITHLGVKDDNETRTLNFRMPKIYKGLDMSGYTIEINFINANGKGDSALAKNIQVGDEEITFQWCAGGTVYAKDGKIRFLVYTYLENEDGTRTNEWHTTWARLEVLDGGNVDEQIAEENPRIIEEMLQRISNLEGKETGEEILSENVGKTFYVGEDIFVGDILKFVTPFDEETRTGEGSVSGEGVDGLNYFFLFPHLNLAMGQTPPDTVEFSVLISEKHASITVDEYVTVHRTGLTSLERIERRLSEIEDNAVIASTRFDKDTRLLHFLDENGKPAIDPVYIDGISGTGGGGGTNNATLSASNTTGFISKTISDKEDLILSCTWSSVENEFQTGNGSLNIIVNGISKVVKDVKQGEISINVKDYLTTGGNVIKWTISDVYGNQKTLSFNITVVTTSLTSSFDATVHYTGDITFPFVATGATTKTMQFVLDGSLIGSSEVTTSGRQQNFTIPKQSHGAHTFEVYFTANINDNIVESNHLYYDIMFVEDGNNTPIIASSFHVTSISQFYTASIPWIAYTPGSLTSDVTLYVNGEVYKELTGVDRTMQVWPYRADEPGELLLEIETGGVRKPFELTVSETDIDVSAEENDLGLYLTSYGRSNNEANPDTWNYGNIHTEFENFNFVSDGWQLDNAGNTVMRVAGDARLKIPYQIFANDFRTSGKTIEFEIATRNVLDYDATLLSCMSGGRGINITTQMASFASEQSSISTKYKEEETIRISFVVEKRSGNKLLFCYINGTLARCCLYSDDDDFSQALPVDITIGSNECITDIYNIRVYDNDLTRYQMIDNWIADTPDALTKKDRYDRNNIYDEYGNITIETLKKDVPYLVLICPVLPTFKGDKKTCSGYYVDPVHPERSFTFENATIDVQGTSSQYYWIKNIKAKFSNGVTLENGTLTMEYQLNGAGVGTNVFTFKADVASSEGFLNVVLAQLYNELCPFKTPAQEDNPNVRQTIDGHPMVIFHDNGSGPQFYGKFNFNHDKGTSEVFGFEEGDESWEILQNGTDRVGFKSDDFSGDDWKNDFEGSYPEDNTDTTRLQELASWIKSTDTEQATYEELDEAVTYGDVTYTHDTEEYRLAKFKYEFKNYAAVQSFVFYFLFTLVFLCADQREKNFFPTWLIRLMLWIARFYDADTSMGNDNKGNLTFDYWLEDIDYTDAGDPVFNGQNSVLWKNMRACFWDEITAEYVRLRTTIRNDGSGLPLLSYDVVMNKIKAHIGTWCEAIYNEDAYKKYIEPFILNGDASYLPMLHGSKIEYIQWWLYNRFRYLDSLFVTGTSMEKRIMIRAHAKANVTMKSYVNMYGRVYYNALIAMHRMMRGQAYEFVWDATGAEDAVIGINDADMITDIGDLAPLAPETIDISKATHLERLKFGDENIVNDSMTTVTLGNNVLLRLIDGRNCPKLTGTVDASGCTGLEEAYFTGTAITYLKLPNGCGIKVLHLPETITNLTLQNTTKLTELVIPSYANITTLRLENIGDLLDTLAIVQGMPANSRVRLIGVDWTADSAEELIALLESMRGLDENGNNVDTPQISGTCYIEALNITELKRLNALCPSLTITYADLDAMTLAHKFVTREVSGHYENNNIDNIGDYAFARCKYLTSATFLSATQIRGYAFINSGLINVTVPRCSKISPNAFRDCNSLKKADFSTYMLIGNRSFEGCSALETFIMRSEEICSLGNASAFTNSLIENGTGYIYVPRVLIDSYKTATNWSIYADQFRAIEDYPEICGGES